MHIIPSCNEKKTEKLDLRAQYRELQELRERVAREQARILHAPPHSISEH